VVGGLEIQSESDDRTKTPLLADIPLLGALFQDRSRSDQRTRMYVFIRCSVMRSETFEDLKYASKKDPGGGQGRRRLAQARSRG
jgi:type II secretory pathway component GspD/PulD (secretin)